MLEHRCLGFSLRGEGRQGGHRPGEGGLSFKRRQGEILGQDFRIVASRRQQQKLGQVWAALGVLLELAGQARPKHGEHGPRLGQGVWLGMQEAGAWPRQRERLVLVREGRTQDQALWGPAGHGGPAWVSPVCSSINSHDNNSRYLLSACLCWT